MEYEKIDMGSYNLHFINTDKFKTTLISINFRERVNKEEIPLRRFLFSMLSTSSLKYNTERLLQIKLEDLYSLTLNESNTKFGNIINSYIDIRFLNEKYGNNELLDDAIELLFELIFNPNVSNGKFDSKTFKSIKDELKLQIESLKEETSLYTTIRALENMDSNDPISYSLWGNRDELDKITEESLYEYYKKVLKKSIIDIFIVGNVDKDKVVELFREKFDIHTIKMDKTEAYITYDKCPKTIEMTEIMGGLQQSKLSIICKFLNLTLFERRYVLPLYTSILGGSSNSKLFLNVREKESLAYTIRATNKNPNSIMIISCGINSSNYDKTVKIIKNELKNMKKNITDEELDNVKNEVITTLDGTFDNQGGIVNYYFGKEVFKSDTIEDRKINYNKVTKKDIYNLANKLKIAMIYLLKGDNNEEN